MDRQTRTTENPRMGKRPKPPAGVPHKPGEEIHLGEWLHVLDVPQNEVAKAAGIGESYLSLIISGQKKNPAIRILLAISRHLGISVNDLYTAPPSKSEVEALGGLSPRQWMAFLEVQAMMKRKK